MEENTAKTPEKEPDSAGKETADAAEVCEQSNPESPSENADNSRHSNNSEYETVDESGEEGEVEEEEKSERRRSKHSLTGSEREGSVILEREEGDGQESVPTKKVDDDEDKKNPQYIPKRGTFYEHDDRTADDVEEAETPEAEKENKKKVWQDKKEKWSHDRFNDSEQAPKSRAELIAIYGYDIRNEDGPPRARRRRRYGRGPNKYTRNWEDEDAYSKPPVSKPKKPPMRRPRRQGEEFPPLESEDRNPQSFEQKEKETVPKPSFREKVVHEEKSSTSTQQDFNNSSSSSSSHQPPPHAKQEMKTQPNTQSQNGKFQQRAGTGRVVKPQKEIKDSDYKGFTRPRNYRNSKIEQKSPTKKPNRDPDFIQSQNFTNRSQQQSSKSTQELESEMGKLSVQDGGVKNGGKSNSQRQGSVPPRLQGEQKSSKRYSSLRQRSLPETAAPPFGQHPQGYYPNEFNQAQQSAPSQQQAIIHPATTQVPQIPPPPLPAMPQQVAAVPANPILQAPPQYSAPFPQPPPAAFLQPGVAAPPFIPQQTPLINYVQNQAQFTQAPFTGFQQAYSAVNQPTELYQPQGGITYYSAQEQQVAQRAAPLKRPKAAIPIVPPPPSEPRGRGRNTNQPEPSPNNTGTEAASDKSYEINKEFEDAAIAVEQ